jgi:hypothetical protein
VQEVARRASVSRPAVWRWQARYAEQGDKTHGEIVALGDSQERQEERTLRATGRLVDVQRNGILSDEQEAQPVTGHAGDAPILGRARKASRATIAAGQRTSPGSGHPHERPTSLAILLKFIEAHEAARDADVAIGLSATRLRRCAGITACTGRAGHPPLAKFRRPEETRREPASGRLDDLVPNPAGWTTSTPMTRPLTGLRRRDGGPRP